MFFFSHFCFVWPFPWLSMLNSDFCSIGVQLHFSFSFSFVALSFCSLSLFALVVNPIFIFVLCLFFTRGKIFFSLCLLCWFCCLYSFLFCVFFPSSLHLPVCVFSLLCLKQREQWTWCQIMQISSGLNWKQHIRPYLRILFLQLLHPHLARKWRRKHNFKAMLYIVCPK